MMRDSLFGCVTGPKDRRCVSITHSMHCHVPQSARYTGVWANKSSVAYQAASMVIQRIGIVARRNGPAAILCVPIIDHDSLTRGL